MALTLRGNIGSCDVAWHIGGEEMVVLLPEYGTENAVKRADAIRLAIAAGNVLHNGQRIGVTASIGVATYPEHGNDMQGAGPCGRPGAVRSEAQRAQLRARSEDRCPGLTPTARRAQAILSRDSRMT